MARVVWAEESKTGLGFEIGPSYDDVSMVSQPLSDEQSSCKPHAIVVTYLRFISQKRSSYILLFICLI